MIESAYNSVKSKIPEHVELIAVSKTKPVEDILCLYELGHRHFGENKVQEMIEKYERLPKDIHWHMIGHLQTNKVKFLAPFVHLIHAVDSLKLLLEINKQAIKHDRLIPCLMQVHIAREETKFGLTEDELIKIIQSPEFDKFRNVKIFGLMGMATYTDDKEQVRNEFRKLRAFFERLKSDFFSNVETFREISMGMSGDYRIAIEEGSTLIRVGTLIFGERHK